MAHRPQPFYIGSKLQPTHRGCCWARERALAFFCGFSCVSITVTLHYIFTLLHYSYSSLTSPTARKVEVANSHSCKWLLTHSQSPTPLGRLLLPACSLWRRGWLAQLPFQQHMVLCPFMVSSLLHYPATTYYFITALWHAGATGTRLETRGLRANRWHMQPVRPERHSRKVALAASPAPFPAAQGVGPPQHAASCHWCCCCCCCWAGGGGRGGWHGTSVHGLHALRRCLAR